MRGMTRAGLAAFLLLACAAARSNATDSGAVVRRVAAETLAEVGRSRFVAFAVAEAQPSAVRLDATVRGDAFRLLEAPTVLPGAAYTYARIQGERPGTGTLEVEGVRVTVHVVESRRTGDHPAPRITGPADGAVVWGGVMVGVELLDPPAAADDARAAVTLQLPGGTTLQPSITPRDAAHPHRRFAFRLPPDALAAGAHRLTAIARWPDGRATASAVTVRWITPDAGRVARWEGETRNTRERPGRLGKAMPRQGADMRASGGRFAVLYNAGRSACVELDVPAGGGWYQMMVTAAGRAAVGGLPTIGVHVDNQQNPVTNGRILAERWHRASIGLPVFLEEGPHHLSPVFVNGFYASPRNQRALYLDLVEVVRLDGPPSRTGAREAGMRGTSGSVPGMPEASAPVAATAVAGLPEGTLLVDRDVLHVAFTEVHDRTLVPAGLQLHAVAQWAAGDASRAPEVSLLLNGVLHSTQRAPDPRFYVDAPQFESGVNTLQLVAKLDSGAMAFSPVHTVVRTAAKSTAGAIDSYRFHAHDTRWGAGMARRLRRRGGIRGHSVAQFNGNGAAALALPLQLQGRYRVWLEARGQHFQGAPKVRVSLVLPAPDGAGAAAPAVIGKPVDIRNWDADHTVGDVTIPPGAKQLRVHFFNDKNEPGTGDRRVWIRAIRLMRIDAAPAKGGLSATVTWPRPAADGSPHAVHRADVVVCEVSDDRLVRDAILLIDGKNSGIAQPVGANGGRVVLPVPARALTGGVQRLSVLVRDYEGGQVRTTPVAVQLQPQPPARLNGYARAVRLCNRFGYGPETQELAAILTLGETAWLADRLTRGGGTNAGAEAARGAAAIYFPNRESYYHVGRAALHEALADPNPVRARFRAFAENHFTTWIRKTQGPPKAAEHQRFSELGVAPFGELLRASAHSPAMLVYLDQTRSFAGRLNENYARELLELHTLGVHGGYAQADVTKLSAILTGWTASVDGDGHSGGRVLDLTFRYEPGLADTRPQDVIGYRFHEADGVDGYRRIATVLELLTDHPSTARFICGKLVGHYVAFPAPPKLVDACAQVYLATHGDLAAVLRFIAQHPAFWDPALPDRLTSPYDYAMRLARVARFRNAYAMGDFLDRSGMGIFDRETPDGYPEEDQAWADSNALLQRWKFAEGARWQLAALAPSGWRYQREAWTDARRAALVDTIAQRLTGMPLNPQSRTACIELLAGLEGSGNNDQKTQEIAIFIARMPDANLR